MSALPPKADIAERHHHIRFVPKADILRRRRLALFDDLVGAGARGGINGECRPNGRSHVHLIPRRHGDVADARGIIRVITGKAY
jgi:hypothetical protein